MTIAIIMIITITALVVNRHRLDNDLPTTDADRHSRRWT